MPSGKTHDKITWLSVPPVMAGSWWASHDLATTGLAAVSFAFAGLMFSGDLDLKSVQYKRWGWFRWIWLPYQKWIPHRSPLSHGPFLGLATRLLYLTGVLMLFALALWQGATYFQQQALLEQSHGGLQRILLVLRRHPQWVLALLFGLWAGGLSHTLADEWGSYIKRRKRKKKKRRKRSR